MTPSRPLLYPEHLGLVLLTVAAIAGGIWFAVRVLLG
jgi:hypothetical protein